MKSKLAALYHKLRFPLLFVLVLTLIGLSRRLENAKRYQLTIMGFNGANQVLVDNVSHDGDFLCFRVIQADARDCFKSPLVELAPLDQEIK